MKARQLSRLALGVGGWAVLAGSISLAASQPAPFNSGVFPDGNRPRKLNEYSWIHVEQPEPRLVKVHDIVTIVVAAKSEVTLNSRYNRQRNGILKAEIKEFLRIDSAGNLAPAALDGPKIDTQLQSRLQSMGQVTDQEGIRYRIAATVVDVLPNGNLVLEARKAIRTNDDVWEYQLTGMIRSQDINNDNTALSENVANLSIEKTQRGKVFDATQRTWGLRLYDWLFPF